MEEAKEDVRADIAVMRRAAEKADTEVAKAETEKKKQVLCGQMEQQPKTWIHIFNSDFEVNTAVIVLLDNTNLWIKMLSNSKIQNKNEIKKN